MDKIKIYFSDFFNIDKSIIENYGAIDISLINDLPLFIDPFLLFNSENEELRKVHNEMIRYLLFLKIQSEYYGSPNPGMLKSWYLFPEVKQTWLGFSLAGNSGRGLGKKFALELFRNLNSIFKSFGTETITKTTHMEKLCLICPNVGRDKISDFTTNFAKRYLLEYTQKFAKEKLNSSQCRVFNIPKVYFNYELKRWFPKQFYLPCFNDDFVLLTPKCILTRDDTFINQLDMLRNLQNIAPSVDDETLRFELNQYLCGELERKGEKLTQSEKSQLATTFVRTHPKVIDYYLKYKEDHEDEASSISAEQVARVERLFHTQLMGLVNLLQTNTGFYESFPDAYTETMQRVQYLKHVIENQDGYRMFYTNGIPIKKEENLQIMFRLVWFGTRLDVNREVNNGRGPVDFKTSFGKDNSTLIEFKLASNSKLKQNLQNQVEIYKLASATDRAIKVIMYFSEGEHQKVLGILNELEITDCPDVVLIDARNDNKPSASTA